MLSTPSYAYYSRSYVFLKIHKATIEKQSKLLKNNEKYLKTVKPIFQQIRRFKAIEITSSKNIFRP